MIKIGAFEAKTHFSEIIQKISAEGQEYVVTKNGRPVVKIVPFTEQAETKKAVEQIKKLR